MDSFIDSMIRSISCTRRPMTHLRSFTHSLTHSLTHSPTHPIHECIGHIDLRLARGGLQPPVPGASYGEPGGRGRGAPKHGPQKEAQRSVEIMPCDRSSIECCLIEPRVHEPRATWIFLEKREREKMRRVRVPESAGKAGVSEHNRNHSPGEAERNENKNQKKKKEKRKKKERKESQPAAKAKTKPAASSRQLRTAHSAESGERARNYRLH